MDPLWVRIQILLIVFLVIMFLAVMGFMVVEKLRACLHVTLGWSLKDFAKARNYWKQCAFAMDMEKVDRDLPETDPAHLASDTVRAYRLIVRQWVDHVEHLKIHYPYLFSLVIRMSPFAINPSPLVR